MGFWKSTLPTTIGGPLVIFSGSQCNITPRNYILSLDDDPEKPIHKRLISSYRCRFSSVVQEYEPVSLLR